MAICLERTLINSVARVLVLSGAMFVVFVLEKTEQDIPRSRREFLLDLIMWTNVMLKTMSRI